ncbi:hypothetical protein SAMN05444411_11137 [Lutibacter oricola]|uniref:HTH luxR-type domain-containing protein n=1 Tax=Lutibacter oricola TaxID=762486 RepID=A0A1H3FHF5_9FLAO|nr:hypothetical protein [Lutibacter oricola]SDX89808.1 hypothetical protein SAMN05444411_11137 [Lutibacter oricola]
MSLISKKTILQLALLSVVLFISISSIYSQQQKDSLLIKYTGEISEATQKKDTLKIIESKLNLVHHFSGKGLYSKCYDEIWTLLPLVNSPKYSVQKTEVLYKLITLYMVLEQYVKAEETYKEAQQIAATQITDKQTQIELLAQLYTKGAWIALQAHKNLKEAEKLALKSISYSQQVKNNKTAVHYGQLHLSQIYLSMGELEKAKSSLIKVSHSYPLPLQPIHGLLYERLGLYYKMKQKSDSAIYFYELSIAAIDTYNTHADKKLQTLKNLSEIYAQKGNSKKALLKLTEAFTLSEQLFSSNKSQNKELFEIKNKYEAQIQQNKEELKSQRLQILEKEKTFWRFKIILISAFLSSLFGFIFYSFKRKSKIKIVKQQLELQKKEEFLELKNKELLTSATQLLERDSQQKEIKKQLDKLNVKGENTEIVKELKSSLKINTSIKWKEFESHFTSVNDNFYTTLKNKFPKLTPTDLKMCAFIKLGFSSKDMSQIMGLSVEGINTSRSRLRKKMQLDRKIILAEFLQDFK